MPRFLLLSRKRKALHNNLFVPASLLFWCFHLLFVAYAHAHQESKTLHDKTCWRTEPKLIKQFIPGAECPSVDTSSHPADWSPDSIQADTRDSGYFENQSLGEYQYHGTTVKDLTAADNLSLDERFVKDTPKSDRLLRDGPLGFDEFKNKAIKGKPAIHQARSIMHRVEPSGAEYNFASASKGAKVLAANKEAKGAPNILGKDMDKYLRNPCSAAGKFVIVELSEETLVHTVEIANFEHHSANLKDFELLGSSVYPTDSWMPLGNFTAKNIKQSQRFTLKEPKWVRYLKLNFLSHYGSEFYCTLSTLQVYGVDAVEHMLEDLISVQDKFFASEPLSDEPKATPSHVTQPPIDVLHENLDKEVDTDSAPDDSTVIHDSSFKDAGDQVGDLRQHPVGRVPGDSVLKIMMQKVRSLDLNLSVLERYLEELNLRYQHIFTDFEKEIAEKNALIEMMTLDLMNLGDSKNVVGEDIQNIMSWKLLVSLQMDILKRENAFFRLKVERILENQAHMENKGIIVFLISLVCSIIAIVKLFADMRMSVCRSKQEFGRFCQANTSWIFLLLCSCTTGIILIL